MKLYSYDCGWRGSLICIAESKDEAIKKFKETNAYCLSDNPINEYDLNEVIEVGGDY